MKTIVHAHYRMRRGMRVRLAEGIARVVRVNECAAVCEVQRPAREFTTASGERVRIRERAALVRISPNSEVEVL